MTAPDPADPEPVEHPSVVPSPLPCPFCPKSFPPEQQVRWRQHVAGHGGGRTRGGTDDGDSEDPEIREAHRRLELKKIERAEKEEDLKIARLDAPAPATAEPEWVRRLEDRLSRLEDGRERGSAPDPTLAAILTQNTEILKSALASQRSPAQGGETMLSMEWRQEMRGIRERLEKKEVEEAAKAAASNAAFAAVSELRKDLSAAKTPPDLERDKIVLQEGISLIRTELESLNRKSDMAMGFLAPIARKIGGPEDPPASERTPSESDLQLGESLGSDVPPPPPVRDKVKEA